MLESERREIDAIDAQLSQLLQKRLLVSETIAEKKYQHHIGLTNRGRESVLMEGLLKQVQEDHLKPYIKDLFRDIILVSKQIQAKRIKALQDRDDDSKRSRP